MVICCGGVVEDGDGETVGKVLAVDDGVAVSVTVAVGAGFEPPQAAKASAAITTASMMIVQRVLCGEVMAPHSSLAAGSDARRWVGAVMLCRWHPDRFSFPAASLVRYRSGVNEARRPGGSRASRGATLTAVPTNPDKAVYYRKQVPLFPLVDKMKLWPSRRGILHGIKTFEVRGSYAHITTHCNKHMVVHDSKNSRAARWLRNKWYAEACEQCRIPDWKRRKYAATHFKRGFGSHLRDAERPGPSSS
jgi:pyrrolysyl-tRNA synthetase-like protein